MPADTRASHLPPHPDEVGTDRQAPPPDTDADKDKSTHKPLPAVPMLQGERLPARQWIIRDWLPQGAVTLLNGPGGAGKSRLALQLCMHLAAGKQRWISGAHEALDLVSDTKYNVLYYHPEDTMADMQHRIPDDEYEDWQERIGDRIWSCASNYPLWTGNRDGTSYETGMMESLRAFINEREVRLLVVDPAAAVFHGNEIVRADVRGFMGALNRLAAAADMSIILITHPKKGKGPQEVSGSTDWVNAARCVWELNPDANENNLWELHISKANYGRPVDKVSLTGFPFYRYTE